MPSSSNCSCDKDIIAMAIHYYEQELAIARPGDASWKTLELPVEDVTDDMIFYNKQFYIITYAGVLIVCNIGDDLDSAKLTIVPIKAFGLLCSYSESSCFEEHKYLVEWLGELVLVIRVLTDPWDDYENKEVQARKIPPSTMYKR
ncbi:hypothetical protein FRX31_003022 [Thalictrum thalictroides]|uniref:KIB1-4 beta-propeller domain-containing protein n=1 Tax=Thalictrum thalictroides TaxID=46969 RepID=A0A7J6XFY8_THATH|nr:hypothetical protein FRX31_003022 [Thalictrum thalictroides]